MATATTPPVYPFDPSGTFASNKVVGERQVINPPDWSDYYFIVPKATPYFAESLKLTLQPSGKELVEGVDYNPSHRFHDASLQCASPVYGSITFLDRTLSGVIEMEYQTLGGDWTVNSTTIAQVLANLQLNPRTTTWEEVVDVPYQFPPIDHEWDLVDMTGGKDVVAAIDRMTTALQESGDKGLANHLADFNNPHKTNATQVGLGNVVNLPLASNADAIAGVAASGYMTPVSTKAAIDAQAVGPLNAHIANTTNPHGVTATQVGLGNVQNYGLATVGAAQAGIVTTAYMNPALTKAAIDAQAVAPLNTHIGRTDNPHGTNATQVGLGNVPNNPMATLAEALAGNATDRFMSPSLVKQVMNGNLGGSLTAHIADHNNPHQVSAAQVGLDKVQNFPIASNAQAIAGTDQASYMTPATTKAALDNVTGGFAEHINNHGNPHEVTADQVGLGNVNNYGWSIEQDAIDGISTAGYMNPALTKTAIQQQVGNAFAAHAEDTSNPHEVTADQVGAYTKMAVDTAIQAVSDAKLDKTGVAADSDLLEGKNVNQILALVPTPPAQLKARATIAAVDALEGSQPLDPMWTVIGAYDTALESTDLVQLDALSFYVVGGESSSQAYNKPVYRVHLNPNDVGIFSVEQLAGYRGQLQLGWVLDSENFSVTLYAKSVVQRGPIDLLIVSDPGSSFSFIGNTAVTEPAAIQYLTVADAGPRSSAVAKVPGLLAFGGPAAFDVNQPMLQHDTLVQNATVLEDGEDSTAAQAAQVDWSKAIPHFHRLQGIGPDQVQASASRAAWRYDPQQSRIVKAGAGGFDQLVSNQFNGTQGHTLEVLVSSTGTADEAIGLVAAYTDRNGQPQAIHVMRDLGGVTAQPAANRGKMSYKLFSVGYNLFGDDAFDLGSTNTGLTWGDGVAAADRTGSTGYVPVTQGGTGGGWVDRGAIAIRVTLTVDGNGAHFVFETSNYGATAGNITYIDAAKQTISLADFASHQGLQDLAAAIAHEGVRWGFCAYRQSEPAYQLVTSPDKYVRYVTLSQAANGTDTSQIHSYNGSAWVSNDLVGPSAKPGRLFVSDLNQRVYQSCQDGSLQPVNILGYNGTGRAILTT